MMRAFHLTRRAMGRTSQNSGYIIVGMVLMMIASNALPYWQDRLSQTPWVQAEITVLDEGLPIPRIQYGLEVDRPVSGEWRAYVEDGEGRRLATRYGQGRYLPRNSGQAIWTWSAFFDGGQRLAPDVPDIPFRVCVRYHVTTSSNVERDLGPYCSGFYREDS